MWHFGFGKTAPATKQFGLWVSANPRKLLFGSTLNPWKCLQAACVYAKKLRAQLVARALRGSKTKPVGLTQFGFHTCWYKGRQLFRPLEETAPFAALTLVRPGPCQHQAHAKNSIDISAAGTFACATDLMARPDQSPTGLRVCRLLLFTRSSAMSWAKVTVQSPA